MINCCCCYCPEITLHSVYSSCFRGLPCTGLPRVPVLPHRQNNLRRRTSSSQKQFYLPRLQTDPPRFSPFPFQLPPFWLQLLPQLSSESLFPWQLHPDSS